MKLYLFGLLVMSMILSSCGGEGVKEVAKTDQILVPSWVKNTPNNSDSYDAVITVSKGTGYQLAKEKGASQVYSQLNKDLQVGYEAYLQEKEKHYFGLEKKIRRTIIAQLPNIKMQGVAVVAKFENPTTGELSVWSQLKKTDVATRIESSRLELDKHLRHYVHVSDKGSDLRKVLSILPSIPTIELKNQLSVYLQQLNANKSVKELPNDRLAELLEVELSNSFAGLVASLSATNDESEIFERKLSKQMIVSGLNMSAYKSDLIVKYFIEDDTEQSKNLTKVTLVADSEMIDSNGRTFATIGGEYVGQDTDKSLALKQALSGFSDDMVTVIADSIIRYMNKANKTMPLPTVFE